VTDEEGKKAVQEARTALQVLTGGVICTPMEREFFIRGYLLGKSSKAFGEPSFPVVNTDKSTIDLFGHP